MFLINLVEKYLMRPRRLREAIQAVVRNDDELMRRLAESKENKPTNLTWAEEEVGLWKGWVYSSEKKRYYFNDIGSESLMELWEDQWAWEEANGTM